jgi:hypothetical protein
LQLRRRHISGIVLAGIATSIEVESAARAASERGYELTVVIDAVTDLVESAHRNSLEVIFPRLGELATTEEVFVALNLIFPRLGTYRIEVSTTVARRAAALRRGGRACPAAAPAALPDDGGHTMTRPARDSRARRIYARLLRLYPKVHRDRFGT